MNGYQWRSRGVTAVLAIASFAVLALAPTPTRAQANQTGTSGIQRIYAPRGIIFRQTQLRPQNVGPRSVNAPPAEAPNPINSSPSAPSLQPRATESPTDIRSTTSAQASPSPANSEPSPQLQQLLRSLDSDTLTIPNTSSFAREAIEP